MNNKEQSVHVPVMMKEAIDALHLQKGMSVIDATLGGGSYTRALHNSVMPGGRVIAIDQDQDAIMRFEKSFPDLADDITLVHKNYSQIRTICQEHGIRDVDAIVADLGISSDQLERAERGFSFLSDGPIDMRMNSTEGVSAQELVNHASREELMRVLRLYGEQQHARKVADAIIGARPLETTGELSQIVAHALAKAYRGKKIHPATKTFQALRIAVNDEYGHLETFLEDAVALLRRGGFMSVVSFHSGEDRIVKNTFRMMARTCQCPESAPVCTCKATPSVRIVHHKGITPSAEEVAQNPRARSARLRIIEKI